MTQKDPAPHKRRAPRPGKKTTPAQAPPSSAELEERTASSQPEPESEWFEDDMLPGEDIAGMQRPPDDS